MSPSRRRLLLALALVVAVLAGTAGLVRVLGDDDPSGPVADQARPGPVLLVPGYGGGTASLEVLAQALRAAGRTASVVPLPGDGTGDLAGSAAALDAAVAAAVAATGAPSVDLVGYSAGGVVTRLWAQDRPERARRIVTLGSPHHGTELAALGAVFAPGACPLACQQLAPGSPLLEQLGEDDETPDGPQWLSLWTTQDETVTPPDSARLEGAVNVEVQDVCPALQVSHGQLPTDPVVTRIVLDALSAPAVAAPGPAVCD